MEEHRFVKIENKNLPIDNLKNFNFDIEKESQKGFINFVFLAGIIATAVMWTILMIIGK